MTKKHFFILFAVNFGILVWFIFNHELNHDSLVHISDVRRFMGSQHKLSTVYPLMHVLPSAIALFSTPYAGVMATLIIFSLLYIFGMKVLAGQLHLTPSQTIVLLCLSTVLILPYEIDYMNSAVALLFPLYLALFFKAAQSPSNKLAMASLVILSTITAAFHPQFLEAAVIFLFMGIFAYRNKEITIRNGMVAGVAFLFCVLWLSQWGMGSYAYLFIKDHVESLRSGGLGWLAKRAEILLTDSHYEISLAETLFYHLKALGGILFVCLLALPLIKIREKAFKALLYTAFVFGILYTMYVFRITFWINTEWIMMRMLCFLPVVGLPLAAVTVDKMKTHNQIFTILTLMGFGFWRIIPWA